MDLGEYAGCKYLIAVDGYSGYPCIANCGKTAPTSALINGLRKIFIQTAIPEVIWSDGGPQFTAQAFKAFLKRWGVKHMTSSPEFVQSNGRAEASVKNVKKCFVVLPVKGKSTKTRFWRLCCFTKTLHCMMVAFRLSSFLAHQ